MRATAAGSCSCATGGSSTSNLRGRCAVRKKSRGFPAPFVCENSNCALRTATLPAWFLASPSGEIAVVEVASAASAAAVAAAAAAETAALWLGTRLVHHERPAFHLLLVELADRLLRF